MSEELYCLIPYSLIFSIFNIFVSLIFFIYGLATYNKIRKNLKHTKLSKGKKKYLAETKFVNVQRNWIRKFYKNICYFSGGYFVISEILCFAASYFIGINRFQSLKEDYVYALSNFKDAEIIKNLKEQYFDALKDHYAVICRISVAMAIVLFIAWIVLMVYVSKKNKKLAAQHKENLDKAIKTYYETKYAEQVAESEQ